MEADRLNLEELFARVGGGMRYDLACMHALLAALGSPEADLKVVLVAGTNGKGSTSKLLAGALQQAGLRCGLFTSPHLRDYRERIQINGAWVEASTVAACYAKLLAVEPQLPRPFSFFEATVAMACMAFVAAKVDVAVFEAGLGGRLDATNVFLPARRLCCLLSRVDLDHEAILGHTAVAIAHEKAGLWRRNRPAVVAPQAEEVGAALQIRAGAEGVPATFLTAQDVQATAALLPPHRYWPGFMQQNAALAWAGCKVLAQQGFAVTENHFRAAAQAFRWPGRYQRLICAAQPLAEVIVDGGHNPAGFRALAEALVHDTHLAGRAVHAIIGVLGDKDLTAMLAALGPHLASISLCATAGKRGRSEAELAQKFATFRHYPNVTTALSQRLRALDANDVLLVAGSLSLVAQATDVLQQRQYVDDTSA